MAEGSSGLYGSGSSFSPSLLAISGTKPQDSEIDATFMGLLKKGCPNLPLKAPCSWMVLTRTLML